MIRDFTRETIADLYETIRVCVEEEEQFQIFDYFEDLFSEELEIGDYIDDVRAYHRHMFDKHDMSARILDSILQRVDETERSYAARIAGYRQMLEAFEHRVNRVCEMIHPEKIGMGADSYAKQMDLIRAVYEVKKASASTKVQDGIDELADIKAAEVDKIYSWLATDYKMTDEELEEAKVILSRYLEPGTSQYDMFFAADSYSPNLISARMSDAELKEYQLMLALYNKCSTLASFQIGFLNGIPFFGMAVDALGKYNLEAEGKTPLDVASFETQKDNSYTQHMWATATGEASMLMLELAATAALATESTASVSGTGTGVVDDAIEAGTHASPNKIDSLLDGRPELAGSTREKLLATVQDPELSKIVNELYRPGATVGDGGTAAKLVEEFSKGSSTHLLKATERLKQLKKLASSGKLGLNDLDVVEALIDDLESAISLYN